MTGRSLAPAGKPRGSLCITTYSKTRLSHHRVETGLAPRLQQGNKNKQADVNCGRRPRPPCRGRLIAKDGATVRGHMSEAGKLGVDPACRASSLTKKKEEPTT